MNNLTWYMILIPVILSAACVRKTEDMTGPTLGRIRIMADESLREIVMQEEEVFERLYKYAHLDIMYAPEYDVVQHFLHDSIDVMISYHPLTPEETAFFNQKGVHPREFAFATGAIAFITGPAARDTAYAYEELLGLFRDPASGKRFVIENVKSGITQEVLRLLAQTSLPAHFYALDTKREVLEYVSGHDNAIGLIDYTDISDSDSAYAKEVLAKYRLVGIARPVDSLQVGYVLPWQYNLQDRKYPFTRDMYFVTKTGRTDVSIGFASFICEEKGQRIILKAGLLPKYQTERNIELKPVSDINVIK